MKSASGEGSLKINIKKIGAGWCGVTEGSIKFYDSLQDSIT